MDIGKRIREARKRKNLTQEQLATKCGLATITIRQYELGKREPRIDQLKDIANALGESFAYLVAEDYEITRKEVISSLKFSDYLSSIGYEFHLYLDDDSDNTWLCVNHNEMKLHLLTANEAAALEAALHSYVKFQISEVLKNAKEIPDTQGWFKKKNPPQD